MFKIIKISESQLSPTSTEEEVKPVEKAEAKPAEKAVSKIKLIKFTPDRYDYQEDKVFMDLEILAASYAKHSEDSNLMNKILEAAKTDPQKAYEIALDSYVEMDHKKGSPQGNLESDEKLKAKRYLGYKLNRAKHTFSECLKAIEDESIGNTYTGFLEHHKSENKSYAELITGLKKWDKKLKKMMTPEQPVKKAPAKNSDEAPKTEKKEASKPKGESFLIT